MNPTMKAATRQKINRRLADTALNGFPYFENFGKALCLACDILSRDGIELGTTVEPPLRNKDRVRIPIAWTNKEDIYSPVAIPNTDLLLVFEEVKPYKFEVVAYLT